MTEKSRLYDIESINDSYTKFYEQNYEYFCNKVDYIRHKYNTNFKKILDTLYECIKKNGVISNRFIWNCLISVCRRAASNPMLTNKQVDLFQKEMILLCP